MNNDVINVGRHLEFWRRQKLRIASESAVSSAYFCLVQVLAYPEIPLLANMRVYQSRQNAIAFQLTGKIRPPS